MKVFLVISLIVVGLCFVNGEITPRFPGIQPILVKSDAPPVYYTDFEDKVVIDDFSLDTFPPVVVQLPSTGAPPAVTSSSFDLDDGILGGERDIILTAEDAESAQVFSAGASGGVFSIATPRGGSGFCQLQYDGIDASRTLSINPGLNGFDLSDGDAIGFRILALTDIDTVFFVTVVDTFGRSATVQGDVPGGVQLFSYFIDFATFLTTIDFTSVAAIEFEVEAFENVDFNLETFTTYGGQTIITSDCFTGAVLPCDIDYYRIETLTDVAVGDYLKFYFNTTGEESHPDSGAVFYLTSSEFVDLQTELATNDIIVDTLGALPGRNNYIYKCESDCAIEIVWSALEDTTYYIGVEGRGDGISLYQICHQYANVPVFQLFDQVPQPIFFDQRATYPPADRVVNYRYYVIDVPDVRFSPGTYLTVNVSRVSPLPGTVVRIMYESLPETAVDTGILDQSDFDSSGDQVDDMIFPWCVDYNARPTGSPNYIHPVRTDTRIPCECATEIQLFGDGPFYQLTCQLYVDPCRFQYGNYYISVELPEREEPWNSLDISGELNYTITAKVVQPVINELTRNATVKGFLEPELMLHFFIDVLPHEVIEGETHFLVHVSNVRNAFVDVFVHQGLGGTSNSLAGGPEACVPANATCHTCDACNIVIEKCHFVPGTWYISVAVSYDENLGEFQVFDLDRLPVTFTLRADWMEDAVPQLLVAGVPVSKYIGASLYDFYVIDVPATIDTWLFVELYAQACDTEVILSILHGALPGGECYARPDFYCITGDPKERVWTTGPPTFYEDEPVQRESCSFMIQTCELEPGPLFISVYGHHTGYAAYGDTTFYQVPVHYTLWADFDVALALTSAVSYSETVFEKQYQHYYIRADQIEQGSWLSVEITNIRHGIPQTIEAFVNYNYLAGNCPCYDHLYNCTGSAPCSSVQQAGGIPHLVPDWEETTLTCCTIVVPASDFRPGVWYVSVLGINEDYYQYTTPIGYTLTVTIHDAPDFYPLILGQTFAGEVPQWNHTLEYAHFRLGAEAVPLNDLVIKVTFVQNCEFLGKHDDSRDSVWLFVNKGSPATAIGWDYFCQANIPGDSYCTIVIPHCEWTGDDYFIAVQGDYSATFTGRFTLRAFTDEVRDIQLTDGIPYYDRVSEGRYKHYFIYTTAEESQYLDINIYTNSDQDAITAFLNKDTRAGDVPCFDSFAECHTKACCSWQLLACELEPGRYYISVYGVNSQFYETSVEFTLTATHTPVSLRIFNNEPVTGHLYNVGDVQHYAFEISEASIDGEYLLFTVDNVKHGQIQAFGQHGSLAGRCPCYIYEYTCSTEEGIDWCEIRVPTCELQFGTYFFSVWAVEVVSPNPLIYSTPIGFVVEASVVESRIIRPVVAVGRNTANTEVSERLFNEHYLHYEFSYTLEDYAAGYHVIVEITQVQDAVLNVYYNTQPSDRDCKIAEICTSGLSSGRECHWQLPFSLVRPSDEPHYITVVASTGREVANYNILIFKQAVPSILANPGFSLDDDDDTFEFTSASFPLGAEVNITHVDRQEPNGWTQFLVLSDASHTDTGRGDMLEIFFYRVTNNPGEPLAFNVYVYPEVPAGAHGCCDRSDPAELGYCQNAPTLNTADTTTSADNGRDVLSHLCSFGVGSGNGPSVNSDDPFYGDRCTVRVWPCEFHKYCNRTLDWFVSVVPVVSTDPSSPGPGLQYSVQWRSRNIRLSDATGTTTASVDLTPTINTYDFEPDLPHVIPTTSTENQGWASFYVDWSASYGRLSIQTDFVGGTGEVFIHHDTFASEGPFYDCWDYRCSTEELCGSANRFIVTEACSDYDKAPERWYITVRNTGNDDADDLEVYFRIYTLDLPATIVIPQNPSEIDPYVHFAGESVFTGITGVEGDNYDFFQMTIDDNDIAFDQSWVIEIEYDDDDDASSTNDATLEIYIRYGAEPGLYGPDDIQSYYDPEPEGAHSWLYKCVLETPGEVCTYQIPSCALKRGFWYIAIRNPAFQLELTPDELPDYTLVTYISDPPVNVGIDEQVFSTTLTNLGLYQHFVINITADLVDFDQRDDLSGSYWTNYLRFQLDNIEDETGLGIGSVDMWVNYGYLAGSPLDYPCLDYFATRTCDNAACFVDVTPCEQASPILSGDKPQRLVTGTYYVSVRQRIPSTYSLLIRVYFNEYSLIPVTQSITGTGHRSGTNNDLYRVSPGDAELTALGDGSGNFRYVIDPTAGGDDDIPDNQYFVVNITAASDTFWNPEDSIHLEVWRDDCTRWHCIIEGPDSWCTIDALGLAPCSAKSGRFFFRVENPGGLPFTLDVYRNETTVQTLLDDQIITEIVYPYEYQEYYYEAVDVGQGSTLTVTVCAICGQVEAFLRADTPAGPASTVESPQLASLDCAIDYCSVEGPKDTTFEPENNCCTLFLDTCQYDQRGYYVGIRGVTIEYPDPSNPNLYLPAKYEIQAHQTTVNFTEIHLSCPETISYSTSWDDVPRQYYIDLETATIAESYYFSLRVPEEAQGASSTLYISRNKPLPYVLSRSQEDTSCPEVQSCVADGFNSFYCLISLPCLQSGRWYIWADAPRGSEIAVNRYDGYIPIIHTDLWYHGSLGASNAPEFNYYPDYYVPYVPGRQIYRFDLNPNGDENYYEKFYLQVSFTISRGSVAAYLYSTGCATCINEFNPFFTDGYLADAESDSSFSLKVTYDMLLDNTLPNGKIPTIFYLLVIGTQQDCELHAITYDFVVKTQWELTYLPVDTTICDHANDGECNFHRLRPREVEWPQQTILNIQVEDLSSGVYSSKLYLNDGRIAIGNDVHQWEISQAFEDIQDFSLDWICGYSDLYLSICNNFGDGFDYRLTTTKVHVPVKELFDDTIYYADDDDDDACPHEHDYYIFKTAQPLGHHHGSFFRVLVDSLFNTQVYVNKHTFAWQPCHDSGYGSNNPSFSGTTSVNVYDFCDFADGVYYITVVSDGPYYIYTDIRDDAIPLTIGEVYRDTLEPGQYQAYTLEICKDWLRPDDRLVVEISDVEHGDVFGWINHGKLGGFKTVQESSDEFDADTLDCSISTARAEYVKENFGGYVEDNKVSGYDYMLVAHYELTPGTYYILIRAGTQYNYPEVVSAPRRNCQDISFRLFPYLLDYEIEPAELVPNVVVTDAVDSYYINRASSSAIKYANYYKFMPLMENDGFFEQVSHGVVRVLNIEGGLLSVRVLCTKLAINTHAYIPGEIEALTQFHQIDDQTNIQYGRRPYNYQPVLDNPFTDDEDTCDGAADYCAHQELGETSLAIWLPSCYFIWEDFFIAIEPKTNPVDSPTSQFYIDHPISYDLVVEDYRDYILLQPNTNHLGDFTDGNWGYDFYYSISAEPESMRWRVVVTSGEGVMVSVYDHRCPKQSTCVKEIWCDASYYAQDRAWTCDIEIPTRAEHSGHLNYFLAVHGKNATYSIAFWRGRENCHDFTGSGRNEGLDFCAGLVPYTTWRWDNYQNLDYRSRCYFEQLYDHFKVQPCWSGVSAECNSTLQAFACYETFHRCDAQGFQAGTCRDACEAVEYECVNRFQTVDLEHFDCASHRYLDSRAEVCSGGEDFSSFDYEHDVFLGDIPDVILFKSSPSVSSANTVVVNFVLAIAALVVLFF